MIRNSAGRPFPCAARAGGGAEDGGRDDAADLAGERLPARGPVRRRGDELRDLLRGGRAGGAVPVRRPGGRRRRGDPHPAPGGGRLRVARVSAGRHAGAQVRVPGARALRPAAGPALQPGEAAPRPVRARRRGRGRLGRVLLRLRLRGPVVAQRRRLGRAHDALGRRQPVLRLGRRPPAADALPRDGHLRGARQGPHRTASGDPAGDARHLRGPRPPGDHRSPALDRA